MVPKRTCATTMFQLKCSAEFSGGMTMHGPGKCFEILKINSLLYLSCFNIISNSQA